jgi:hypothetical protein
MEEVVPDAVAEYLQRMREEGYRVIALEQTAESVCLSQYRFPDKVDPAYIPYNIYAIFIQ